MLLILKAPIHGHKYIVVLEGSSKQLPVLRPRPADGLNCGDLMARQFGDKIAGQVLVKQNAHWL